MASPSSGYHYDTYYLDWVYGPIPGGSTVWLTDSGAVYVDYYTNNPNLRAVYWGTGYNSMQFMGSRCPSFWCRAGLFWWGAHIKVEVPAGATYPNIVATGH
ncbi:MAG: hypothetical protein KatS3mg063_0210 [Tepidiforma sp.]|nr:MAG: hypothetical protein KatS3mg063_0210 [Tepidiforma sp.]